MKKIALCLSFILTSALVFSQIRTECGALVPSTTCPAPQATSVCPDETVVPVLGTSGSPFTVPTVEFVITDPNTLADDFDDLGVAQNLGPAIIAVDADGVFTPEELGLPECSNFQVTVVTYNLGQIQLMIDNLYNNTFAFIPCCTLAESAIPGLCATLMASGINSGSDIQDLTDVFALLEAFGSTGTSSIVGFLNDVDQINIDAATLPDPCGGAQLPICYAANIDDACTYSNHDIPSIDLIGDNSPTSLDITASSCEAVEYSIDGINFQSSSSFLGSAIPQTGTVYVRTVVERCLITAPYNLTSPLPIELLFFKAEALEASTLLYWASSQEINHAYYGIERSEDGTNFQEIARVNASGNSAQTINYDYKDESPLNGISYYRLVFVSTNNDIEYSEIRSIERDEKKNFQLIHLSPNPAYNQLNVAFSSDLEGDADYQIMDLSGRQVLLGSLSADAGINNQLIDITNLPKGLYLIHLKMDAKGYSMRFIKD